MLGGTALIQNGLRCAVRAMGCPAGVGRINANVNSSVRRWSSQSSDRDDKLRATTVLCVRKESEVVIISDGQMSLGETVMKGNMKKARVVLPGVIAGIAGSATQALMLLDIVAKNIDRKNSSLYPALHEMAKQSMASANWRGLQGSLIIADKKHTFCITGGAVGDIVEVTDDPVGIGSGGMYAQSAARALMGLPSSFNLSAEDIARRSMEVASDLCIYTNSNFTIVKVDNCSEQEEEVNPESPGKVTLPVAKPITATASGDSTAEKPANHKPKAKAKAKAKATKTKTTKTSDV